MKIKWTKEYEYDFPDDDIMDIASAAIAYANLYPLDKVKEDIKQEIRWAVEDIDMPWGKEQTDTVANVVLERMGGIQLSMFEGEETFCGAIEGVE